MGVDTTETVLMGMDGVPVASDKGDDGLHAQRQMSITIAIRQPKKRATMPLNFAEADNIFWSNIADGFGRIEGNIFEDMLHHIQADIGQNGFE